MKILFFLSISSMVFFLPKEKTSNFSFEKTETFSNDSLQISAFEILETKCNVCHAKKNRKRIFTMDNMNKYRKKINRQVFKWKRMPKGDEYNLTKKEYAQLKNWLNSIK